MSDTNFFVNFPYIDSYVDIRNFVTFISISFHPNLKAILLSLSKHIAIIPTDKFLVLISTYGFLNYFSSIVRNIQVSI